MNAQSPAPSLAERVEAQRKQLFKVMSIVEACRLGSDSMLATICGDEDGEPDFEGALAAAYELLDDVADELEGIAGDGDGGGKPDVPGPEAST